MNPLDLFTPDIAFVAIFPIVSFLLSKLIPSEARVKFVTRALSYLIVAVVKYLMKRYKEHHDHVDHRMHHIADLFHKSNSKVAVG